MNPEQVSEYISSYEAVPENFASAPVQTISVGNYSANLVEGMDQWIVDEANQAAMFGNLGKLIIADYAHQGFKAIINNNRATVCGQVYSKASQYYGVNNGDLWLNDGRYYCDVPDGSLIMYTCVGADPNVIITYWNPVSEYEATYSEPEVSSTPVESPKTKTPKTPSIKLSKAKLEYCANKVYELNQKRDQ